MSKTKIFRSYPLCGIKGTLFFYFYNPLAYLYRFFLLEKKKKVSEDPPLNILLCCEAAIGDVVLASSVVPILKNKFPSCHIGFLCKKETSFVLESIQGIDSVHFQKEGKKKELIREIQKSRYDVSLELHPFFQNSIPLMRKAGIRKRIGFDSAGYDVWMTDPISFPQRVEYLPKLYTELLAKLGIQDVFLKPAVFFQPPTRVFPQEYILLHLGTSNPLKEWDVQKWRELAVFLKAKGFTLLCTGKGQREKSLIQQAFQGLGEDLCDALTWNDFMAAIAGAKAVISVDSVSVHLAALFRVPLLGLYLYNHVLELWLPDADKACFLVSGRCVRKTEENHPKALYVDEVGVSDVLEQLGRLI